MSSSVVRFRLKDSVYGVILDMMEGENKLRREKKEDDYTVSSFMAEVCKRYIASKADGEVVKPMGVPSYNPLIHKPGDRVLMRIGNRLVVTTVPKIDGDGNAIPEVK